MQSLADEAPVYVLEGEEKAYNTSKNDYNSINVQEVFDQLLTHPTIASKHYLYEQYDQQVGANTIIKPGLQSSVVRVEGTQKRLLLPLMAKHVMSLINHMKVENGSGRSLSQFNCCWCHATCNDRLLKLWFS